MLYNPPTGSQDPDAHYIGKNVAAGVQGSKVPPAAIEYTQREIVDVIAASGQSPSNGDLQQLLKAVRSGVLSFFSDTGTADAMVIAPNPIFTTVQAGTEFCILKAGAANATTAPKLTVNQIPPATILKQDGTPMAVADLPANCMITVRYDGAAYRVTGLRKSDLSAASIIASNPSISPPRNLYAQATAGTYSFTVPALITWIYPTVVGAGGGGGGGGGSATWSSGGGGSGGTTAGWIAVTPGQVITYVVGAGGAGGSNANGAAGSTGGSSSFGATFTATGGGGGQGGTSTSAGGGPGVGSGGGIALYGAIGGDGNPGNANIQGGAGAASSQGGGGRTSTLTAGTAGLAPGSGGGGIWATGGSGQTGGRGADGLVSIAF